MKNFMRLRSLMIILGLGVIISCTNEKKREEETQVQTKNPILVDFNETIGFEDLTAEHIAEAEGRTISRALEELQKIYDIPAEERTFDNTMDALDAVSNQVEAVSGIIYLTAYTNTNGDVRTRAQKAITEFGKFSNQLLLEEKLYKAVKEYAQTDEAKNLIGYKAKFLKETIEDFERNGLALPAEKREELKKIRDKLSELGVQFSTNIAEAKDHLIVGEEEVEGLPEDYKKARKTEDGKYKIDLTYPSYVPFMKYSKSDKARKELYIKYKNRAADKNLDILKEILVLRQQMAEILGYKTYAEYRISDRMAKTPENVWNFENELIENLQTKAEKDIAELVAAKQEYTNDKSASKINAWEASFYNNILLNTKYNLDAEEVKQYFELNNVINGLFTISQHLYNVTFEETQDLPVWHEDVKAYNVKRDGNVIGRFYLDLHPRDNKYGHAACFPMVPGRMTAKGYRIPTASLVCNFPKPTEETPSLMLHDDVTTFFHEFGHLLHNLLTTSPLSAFAGTSVARDFVETPSQMYENWTWNYESLKLFAKHYETGEVLPKELYDKMLAAKNVGSAVNTLQQIFYGVVDMTLHDKYDPNGDKTTTEVIKELQNEITPYDFVEGTHLEAAFGHLDGYAAGYYGYLWALVYAEDVFSVFAENGIMNQETGIRYLETILSKGGTKDELEMVKDFLGREPNQKAFLKSLGVEIIQ